MNQKKIFILTGLLAISAIVAIYFLSGSQANKSMELAFVESPTSIENYTEHDPQVKKSCCSKKQNADDKSTSTECCKTNAETSQKKECCHTKQKTEGEVKKCCGDKSTVVEKNDKCCKNH